MFPDIAPGGSLLLAWQVKNKHCLVIGGGEVAAQRVNHLLAADAKVTVISPTVNDEIRYRSEKGQLYSLVEKKYESSDLTLYEKSKLPTLDEIDETNYETIEDILKNERFAVVCVAIDDHKLSTKIFYQAKSLNLQVNIADKPKICDFYFGAMYRSDALQVMISTNGKSPRMAAIIRNRIGENLSSVKINKAIENLGALRSSLREKISGEDLNSIDTRMQWIKDVTDLYSLEKWSELDDSNKVSEILGYFPDMPLSDLL